MALSLVVLRVLTNRPEDAAWLSPDEKAWLTETLAAERRVREAQNTLRLSDAFKSIRAWLFGLMYFGIVIGVYGLTLWLPQIIKGFGGLSNVEVGF